MPHVIVKLLSGRTDAQKQAIADEVTKAILATANKNPDTISVAIEDVAPEAWDAEVYEPDIKAQWDTLFKKPKPKAD